jgi:hypothetical protein
MCGCGCELAIVMAEAHPETSAAAPPRDGATVVRSSAPVPISDLDWIVRLMAGLVPGWRASR